MDRNIPAPGTFINHENYPQWVLGRRALLGHIGDMVPNNLKELRVAAGLTQNALAEAVGTKLTMLGKLERGERPLDVNWLEKLAPHLNVAPYEIIAPLKVAAPDTPATAWEPDLALLTKTIEGALPYVWAGQGDPDIAPKVAQMIAAVSHAVAMNPAILDTEASTAQAVQVVGVSIFGGPPPPTPLKPSTQRRSSGNS